jgi:superfamily II DNA or RNA helicase
LIKQWEDSILKFCPSALVQKLTTKTKLKDSDFYIMNAMNIEKMGRNFFQNIGLVICDEAHMLVAETLSRSLQYLTPRYLIGLSATPYRLDGLNKLLDLYFGEDKIIRDMNREHIIYRVNTGIEIEMEILESTGKVNWGAVLKSQSDNEKRNKLIIRIIREFKDRNFLVLCKRVEQATYLFNKLKEVDEHVDNLIGSKQEFDTDCRILVGIHQKVGTGFDWAKADALLLAIDLDAYFIQSLGRVFRRRDTTPIVFDLVDNNFILLKHFKNRAEVYENVGGKIVSFNRKYPEFFDEN